jgi:hypothetical protein
MSEEKNNEIIDVEPVEVEEIEKALLPFMPKLPQKLGQLPVPLSIAEMEEFDKRNDELYAYMKRLNADKNGKWLTYENGALFGKIPNTNIKREMCYEPGLNVILRYYQLKRGVMYTDEKSLPDIEIDKKTIIKNHIKVTIYLVLVSAITGEPVYFFKGKASTLESKQRNRGEGRKCPECEKPAIKESRYRNKEGETYYYCHAKAGGCGRQFPLNDKRIGDKLEAMENLNPIDQHDMVHEMALIRATRKVLKATGMSKYFVEEPDDIVVEENGDTNQKQKAEPQKKKSNGKIQMATENELNYIKKIVMGHFGDNEAEANLWLEENTKTGNIPGLKNFSKMAKVQYDYLVGVTKDWQ